MTKHDTDNELEQTKPKAASKQPVTGNVIKDVSPDLNPPESAERFWYWLGLLPTAPFDNVTIAGICFPKRTDLVVYSTEPSKRRRVPQPGDMIGLTRKQVETFADRVRRSFFRWLSGSPEAAERAELGPRVENTGDPIRPRATIMRLPTAEEIAKYEAGRKLKARPIVPGRNDRPVAEFLYMQLMRDAPACPKPRGEWAELPEPISKTGLELPNGDIKPVPFGARIDWDNGILPLPSAEELLS